MSVPASAAERGHATTATIDPAGGWKLTEARAISDGRGVDATIITAGDLAPHLLDATRDGGRLLLFGAHPGTLQDGVHVVHRAEGRWARWLIEQWARC